MWAIGIILYKLLSKGKHPFPIEEERKHKIRVEYSWYKIRHDEYVPLPD
jgi:hypothetical protein